jgi:hypothetical protein
MNINEFCNKIANIEGKKKQVDIAQISEIIKITDDLLDGKLYELIKKEN